MSRTDGRKLVTFAGAAIVGALGIGKNYIVRHANFDLVLTILHTSPY